MATEFICSIRATGGDYPTLTAWEAAIQTDLTSAKTKVYSHSGIVGIVGDGALVSGASSGATGTVRHASATQVLVEIDAASVDFTSGEQMQVDASNYVTLTDAGDSAIAVAEGYADWPSGLGELVTVSGWTVNSTNYIIIRAATGNEHNGTPNTGFFLTGSIRYGAILTIQQDYTKLVNVSLTNTGVNPAYGFDLFLSSIELHKCVAYSVGGAAIRYNFNDNLFINVMAIGDIVNNSLETRRPIFKNCTARSYTVGSKGIEGTAINSVAYGGDFISNATGGWTASSDYNASSNATTTPPPGANSLTTDITPADFVDTAANDYHLSSG